ncbi:MAG: lysylphosphatidylglycerol synthase transmembrane domain-containing protein [Bacteroidales bacterium]
MRARLLNVLKFSFFLALGGFFIWLFLHNLTQQERREILDSLLSARYGWIIVSVLIGLVSHWSRARRWQIMLRPLGYHPGTLNTFFAVMSGYLANMALPRLGEVTRCGVLARYEKIPLQKSFGTVITERAIDAILLLSALLTSLLIHLDKSAMIQKSEMYHAFEQKLVSWQSTGWLVPTAVVLFIAVIALLFQLRHLVRHTFAYQKIKGILLGFIDGLRSIGKIGNPFWFIFHSALIWFCYLMMTRVVLYALPETAGLPFSVAVAVLAFGSVGIVLVQGGIGIYPFIVAETLALFGIDAVKGYAMGWLLWIGQSAAIILVGFLSLSLLPLVNKSQNGLRRLHPEKDNSSAGN